MHRLGSVTGTLSALLLGMSLAACHHSVALEGMTPQAYLAAERPPRVRVTAPSLQLTNFRAVFRSTTSDTLVLQTDTTLRVPWAAIQRLDVHAGDRSRGWLGAGIGFAAGAVLGLGLASAAPEGEDREEVIIYPAAGALAGTLVGTMVGLSSRTDRWQSVPLDGRR